MKKYIYWTKAFFIESFVFLASFFLVLLKKINFKKESSDFKKYKPILLIQGYLHNSNIWLYHAKKLHKKGFGPIYTINFENSFSSVEQHALELEKKVENIKRENKISNLILIGHSMGGLIASYYALNLDKDNIITDIISIATPYDGSLFANIAIGECGHEMKKHSAFVEDLKKQIENDKIIKFYYICSKSDQLVRPQSALIGNDLEKQYIVNDIGHASLLFSKKVNNQITKWLD